MPGEQTVPRAELSALCLTLGEIDSDIVFYTDQNERVGVDASRVGVVSAERLVHAAFERHRRGPP